ncbi:unnamed protein product [Trifolium pratense]|uniref:Uncharacterized protein n=1 Tax=Trifolium pratense TaxID=57577 RepID=A0ACB0JCE7_TRIPR|nr:unnamed protein product [Trifolium pratense]
MLNSDNTVDATVQPFVVVNDHVTPSDKSISDSVVELVTFSIKENITTLEVAQDVGTSSVQPNPNATTITESFGDSCDFEAATEDELQDKEKNDIPADAIEDSKTEESIEKVVSLGDKDTESEKIVDEEQEMIDLDELEEAALEATDGGVDENLSVGAGGDNEEEDSEVEDEGNDSPRQCLCAPPLSSETPFTNPLSRPPPKPKYEDSLTEFLPPSSYSILQEHVFHRHNRNCFSPSDWNISSTDESWTSMESTISLFVISPLVVCHVSSLPYTTTTTRNVFLFLLRSGNSTHQLVISNPPHNDGDTPTSTPRVGTCNNWFPALFTKLQGKIQVTRNNWFPPKQLWAAKH